MSWFWLALGSAFFLASADAVTKKCFSGLAPLEMAGVRLIFGAPILLVLFLGIDVPRVAPEFWGILAAVMPLEVAALLLYMRAIKVSPLSLTIPFLAFTPVWMILTAWLILGEWPTRIGGAGILVVAAGAYLLNLDPRKSGILEPVRAVFREPGSWMMLIVSVIFSVTASAGKKLILLSSPAFVGCLYYLVLSVLILPVIASRGRVGSVMAKPGWGLIVGLATVTSILCHVAAISLAPAAYMVAVKRFSLVFSVLFGHWLFQEVGFSRRLAGSLIMFSGLALITLWG